MKRRVLMITLALCLCIGLLPTAVFATSKTAEDAINWAKSQVGHTHMEALMCVWQRWVCTNKEVNKL